MAHCPGPGPCCAARAVQASPPLLLSKTTEEKASAGCGWAGADWRLCWDGTVHWARQQCNVWAATHSQPANQPGHLPTLLSISTLLPRVCCWGWPLHCLKSQKYQSHTQFITVSVNTSLLHHSHHPSHHPHSNLNPNPIPLINNSWIMPGVLLSVQNLRLFAKPSINQCF